MYVCSLGETLWRQKLVWQIKKKKKKYREAKINSEGSLNFAEINLNRLSLPFRWAASFSTSFLWRQYKICTWKTIIWIYSFLSWIYFRIWNDKHKSIFNNPLLLHDKLLLLLSCGCFFFNSCTILFKLNSIQKHIRVQ